MKLDMFTIAVMKVGLLAQLQIAEKLKQEEIEQGEVEESIGDYWAGVFDGVNCAIAIIDELSKEI